MRPVVAIVGRPNVGKSTLFNRLIRQRKAVVDDRPGVTRDRVYGDCSWAGFDFILIDTGGFIPRSQEMIPSLVTQQAELAIDQADVVMLVLDSKVGVQTVDEEIASLLKKAHKKSIVVANKADSEKDIPNTTEFYNLGLGEVFPIASESGRQVGDMLDQLVGLLPENFEEDIPHDAINIAIIGRPNVGKSSLFNIIVGENRQIVSNIPGTTRDSVDSLVEIDGRKYNFIDTAGLRRKTHYADVIEYYSSLRSIKAIERADIVLVLIDTEDGVKMGDIKVAVEAEQMGRGIIFVANKWDLVKAVEQQTFVRELYEKAQTLRFVPVVFTSAITGRGIEKILPAVNHVSRETQKRIGTSELNSFIEEAYKERHPPARRGKFIKFYYVTQAESKPPTFIFFCNFPKSIEPSYERFLENKLRSTFGFDGVPLRFRFRSRGHS